MLKFWVETLIPETISGTLAALNSGACSLYAITVLRKCFHLICLCSGASNAHFRVGSGCHADSRFRGSYSALITLPGIDVAVITKPSHIDCQPYHPPAQCITLLSVSRRRPCLHVHKYVCAAHFLPNEHQLLLLVQQSFYFSLCLLDLLPRMPLL
jgi:hypothetical protein